MSANQWFLIGGIFFLILVLGEQWIKRGPISSAIIYLLLGLFLGPKFFGVLEFDILEHPKVMEVGAEIVVLISLFSAGLKLQIPFRHPHWKSATILASVAMVITVALLTLAGHYLFALSWGAAVLLGGILAPTDPVLASAIQVEDEKDKDRIRRALTGEAGLNDGTAFPVVMLGLTILGVRWSGADSPLLNWGGADLAWAIPAGLLIGYLWGYLAAKVILLLHSEKNQKLVIEDFVSLGLIATAYGCAQVASAYGFLAVFAAGISFARVEKQHAGDIEPEGFSPALIRFSTQLERIGEIGTVLLVGFIAGQLDYSVTTILFAVLLIFLVRPVAVFASLRNRFPLRETFIISWFGIRGIGSIYYLSYALNHGLDGDAATSIFNFVMVTVVISIVAHGISASPIMDFHRRAARARSH